MKPERLSRTTIYESPKVNLYVDKVRFPAGRVVDRHHIIEFGNEAVAVLVENVKGEILLVHVYRYPTDTIEWEIPAGGLDPGESAVEAAEREVLEESGYETTGHELIYTYHPINGISNHRFHIVRCRSTKRVGDFDENEVQGFEWVPKHELRRMIESRQMMDGFSLVGLLLHLTELEG